MINYLHLLIARAFCNLTGREQKIIDFYFKLNALFILSKKKQVASLGQVKKDTGLSTAHLTIALQELLSKNIIYIKLKDTKDICIESPRGYLVLNENYKEWERAGIKISKIMRTYKLPSTDIGTVDTSGALAKKVLDYFCIKFTNKFKTKYKVHPGTIKQIIQLIDDLKLRDEDPNRAFQLVDFTFDKRKKAQSPTLVKYMLEDIPQFLATTARQSTSAEVDEDGVIRRK